MYKEQISKYQKKDSFSAIALWFIVMVLYTAAGLWGHRLFNSFVNSIITNIIAAAICLALVRLKKEPLSSVGLRLSGKNLLPSLGFGLLLSLIALIFNFGILPALMESWPLAPLGNLLINFVYQLIIIAFTEELIFRGYIQTRLYGLFKNNIAALLMGALLFSLMHVPFQLISGGRTFNLEFIIWLFILLFMHLLFNLIYIRHHLLWGGVVFHAFHNITGNIFIREDSFLDWSLIYLLTVTCAAIAFFIIDAKRHHS